MAKYAVLKTDNGVILVEIDQEGNLKQESITLKEGDILDLKALRIK